MLSAPPIATPPQALEPPKSAFARLMGPDGTLVAVVTCLGAMLTALVPMVQSYDRIERVIGPRWALAVVLLGLVAAIAAVVAGFGHSLVNLLPPTGAEQPAGTASQVVVGAVAGKEITMNANSTLMAIEAILPLFFHNNPTVDAMEVVLPQAQAAIASAKAGQAFSISAPLSVDGVKGSFTFGWSPNAPA